MMYTKDGVTQDVSDAQVKKYTAHGWVPVAEQVKAVEEIIRLKPPVKTRGTAKSSDDITTQGDE